MIFQTLTTRSQDEPSTAYGLLAEAVAYPDDFSYVDLSIECRRRAGMTASP